MNPMIPSVVVDPGFQVHLKLFWILDWISTSLWLFREFVHFVLLKHPERNLIGLIAHLKLDKLEKKKCLDHGLIFI